MGRRWCARSSRSHTPSTWMSWPKAWKRPSSAARLLELGCEFAQGFYYSKAVDAAAAGLLIGSQPWQALAGGRAAS